MEQKNSPGLPPKPADARYLSLDACRGAACLLLLIFHATFFADASFKMEDRATWSVASVLMRLVRLAWAGVPIFFVVSGYCIAASLDSMRRKPFTLWTYFARRIRRIYPPLWIMLTLGVLFVLALDHYGLVDPKNEHLPHFEKFTASNWIGNYSATEWWLHNVPSVGGERQMIMTNTWTLAFEEQFYLLMGAVLVLATRRLFLASALISVLTLVVRHYSRNVGWDSRDFFFDGPWLLFYAGILVYQRLNYLKGAAAWAANAALVAGMVYGVVEYKIGNANNPELIKQFNEYYVYLIKHFGEYLIVAYGFALLLVLVRRWDAALAKSVVLRPLLFLGRMSYSIYLVHYLPVVALASLLAERYGVTSDGKVMMYTLPLCVLVALPPAYLFHRVVERRFLNAPS